MESNFIKERVVVREQIIRKNLEALRKTSKTPLVTELPTEAPSQTVIALEELVNEKLKQDLVEISRQVDVICGTISDYIKVKSALKVFKSNPYDLRVMTNIGCNFYAQCHIENATKIYLCLGQDYFLLMELEEAIKMIEFKEKQWTKRLDELQEQASALKAYIKMALEAIDRACEMGKDKKSA